MRLTQQRCLSDPHNACNQSQIKQDADRIDQADVESLKESASWLLFTELQISLKTSTARCAIPHSVLDGTNPNKQLCIHLRQPLSVVIIASTLREGMAPLKPPALHALASNGSWECTTSKDFCGRNLFLYQLGYFRLLLSSNHWLLGQDLFPGHHATTREPNVMEMVIESAFRNGYILQTSDDFRAHTAFQTSVFLGTS